MKRILDIVALDLLTVCTVFCWSYYAARKIWLSVILTIAIVAALDLTIALVRLRTDKRKNPNWQEICISFGFLGIDAACKRIYDLVPDENKMFCEPPFFAAKTKGEFVLYMWNVKFALSTDEDLARLYRKAQECNAAKAVMLNRQTDRRTVLLSTRLPISVTFPRAREIRRYLIKNNAVPQKTCKPRAQKTAKLRIKGILDAVTDAGRAKYYAFVALSLLFLSLFTPLKLYYLISGTIAAALCIVSLIRRRVG